MKKKTGIILVVMNVLAWIVFIGLMVKAGALLFSYVITIGNPEGAKNVYNGVNLYVLRQYSFWHYSQKFLLMIGLPVLQAYTAFLVTKVLTKIKMANPFTIEISKLIEGISYFVLGIWLMSLIHNLYTKWLWKKIPGLHEELISLDFVFLAGVLFVFSQIFKRGVELQTENELTV
jgi:hypothetical protein